MFSYLVSHVISTLQSQLPFICEDGRMRVHEGRRPLLLASQWQHDPLGRGIV